MRGGEGGRGEGRTRRGEERQRETERDQSSSKRLRKQGCPPFGYWNPRWCWNWSLPQVVPTSHHHITSSHHHIITSSHQHSLPQVVPTSHHHMITSHHHISTLCPQLSLRMRAHTYEVRRNHDDVMQSCTQISQCMHMHCACDCFCMRQCACVLACFCVCICVCSCVHETLGGLESKRKRDKARASKNRSAPLRLKSV